MNVEAIPELPPDEVRDKRARERFKFKYVNEITGTFVIIVILVLLAGAIWTGRSQRWFKSNVTLRIVLPEAGAAGIRQGSEVYFLGTRVGSVSDVLVDSAGHMQAKVSIRHDFFVFVRADSSAVVKKKFGVAGDSFFEITRGEGKPLSEEDASIVCNEQYQSALEAAVEEVRHEAMLVLKKVNGGLETWTVLGTNLISTRGRLDQLVARVDNIATDVQQGKGTAGKLLVDSSIADELNTLLTQANRSMNDLQLTFKNLENATGNLQAASTNLPGISTAISNESKDLPGLVLQTKKSMHEMERLIEAMQKHWLFRRYMSRDDSAFTSETAPNEMGKLRRPSKSAAE